MQAQVRTKLRSATLKTRRNLGPDLQTTAAAQLLSNLKTLPQTQQLLTRQQSSQQYVGAYLAVGGEIDLSPTLHWLQSEGVQTLLPAIRNNGRFEILKFAPYSQSTPLREGKFRISEPDIAEHDLVDATQLDLVLVPLVNFDHHGNRLGMGGGFYDRTFSFRNKTNADDHADSQPQLIGVAHECQRADTVPVEHWDIPMDVVVTDAMVHYPA